MVDCAGPLLLPGSCGNACCIVQLASRKPPPQVYADVRSWLELGGADGSYRYVNSSDQAGHRPSDRLGQHLPDGEGGVKVTLLPDQFTLQGRHASRGGYIDTVNFYIRALSSGGTTLRAFSASNLHGAFSDNGQNYKTLAYMFSYLQPSAAQHIVFGSVLAGSYFLLPTSYFLLPTSYFLLPTGAHQGLRDAR